MTIIKKPFLPLIFMAVMALTRFDHFGSAFSLPDASLAVFFLAGMSYGGLWFFALLLLEAGMIDFLAITQFSVSDYCISPAYVFLIPTYAVMWFAGRYSKAFGSFHLADSLKTLGLAAVAASAAFALSNGSFYLLSDRIEAGSWAHFAGQFAHYYPPYLASTLCYALAGLLIVKLFKLIPGALPTSDRLI
jgi:hypothetical protein